MTSAEEETRRFLSAREIFEIHASGRYSDDTLALVAAHRGYVSVGTERPLSAAGS